MVLPNFQKDNTNPRACTEMRRWADAGFTAALLPIIPPNAMLGPKSAIGDAGRGKTPGVFRDGVWTGFPGWTRVEADDGHIRTWSQWEQEHGAGVGLQARQYPGVDIDVTDEAMSEAIAGLAETFIGPAPHRIGNPPKRLLPYRLAADAEPFGKRRVAFKLPNDENVHAVEILGDGQFYVVAGTHAKTGKPYRWEGGHPADAGPDSLSPVDAGMIDSFLKAVRAHIEGAGGEIVTAGGDAGTGPDIGSGASAEAHAGDPAVIESALKKMGNPFDYDGWIRVSAAIKAALNEDEANYPIFERWCLLHPGNTPEIARAKWDSIRPPYRAGAALVYEEAEKRGWQRPAAAGGFTAVPAVDPTVNPHDPEIIRDWIYVEDQNRFFRPSDRRTITDTAFTRRYVRSGYKLTGNNSAVSQFFSNPRRRVVDRFSYIPGAAAICQDDGQPCANLWREPPGAEAARRRAATVTDADVKPFTDHWRFMVPDAAARETILNWFAFVIQNPGLKPNWAIFLGGGQGIGKDMGIQPLIRAIGEANTSTVQSAELTSDYTSWIANKRLIVIEEMRNFETKAVMNKLKMYITAPPHRIPVNEKYLQRYEIPNVAAFFFMSNFRDALSLEHDDRRYFVYWSPAKPRPASYYSTLAAWMANGGADEVIAWLTARDISAFDAHGTAPHSAAKEAMKDASRPRWEQMMIDAIEDGKHPFEEEMTTVRCVEAWLSQIRGLKHLPNREAITRSLVSLGFSKVAERARVPGVGRVDIFAKDPVGLLGKDPAKEYSRIRTQGGGAMLH